VQVKGRIGLLLRSYNGDEGTWTKFVAGPVGLGPVRILEVKAGGRVIELDNTEIPLGIMPVRLRM